MPETPAESQQKEQYRLRTVISRLLVTTAVFWVPTLLFLALADLVRGNRPLFGDIAILQAVHAISSPGLDAAAIAITNLGNTVTVVPGVLLAASVLTYTHYRRQALFLIFAAAGTGIMIFLFKLIFRRDRPELWTQLVTETSYSFPSGHAMISSALAFSIIALCWKSRYRWAAVAAGGIYFVLVGLSRVYLGVHYPSDIIGGWCVSLLWIAIVYRAFGHFERRSKSGSSQ